MAVTPLLDEWAICLKAAFAASGWPVCRLPVTFNDSIPPMDACDCDCFGGGHGQGWVRWVSTEAAQASGGMRGSACANGIFEITVESGVYRCWPVPETGPLPEDEETRAAHRMLRDAAVLRKTPMCCTAFADENWELIKAEPIGPEGGCTGSYLQLKVLRYDCGCPEEHATPYGGVAW